MDKKLYYHVVTERPMEVGQVIYFDDDNHNGVGRRMKAVISVQTGDFDHKDPFIKEMVKDPEKWFNILERETLLESVRQDRYTQYPSRQACLYVSDSYEDALGWADYFIELGRETYQVVSLSHEGRSFTGDAHNCWYQGGNESMALAYWEATPNSKGLDPIYETIIDGTIQVEEILKTYKESS